MVQGHPVYDFSGRRCYYRTVGIKTDQIHIGYSYDFTVSNLIGTTSGAHEISLIYEFNNLSLGQQRKADQGNSVSGILIHFNVHINNPDVLLNLYHQNNVIYLFVYICG